MSEVKTHIAWRRAPHPYMPRGMAAYVESEGTLYHHADDDVSTNEAIARLKVLFIPPVDFGSPFSERRPE